MKRLARSFILFATTLGCLPLAVPAQAQTRVFVAAQGSDGNPCTFALPCRTFQHAHDTAVSNGEIDVLDPAGYGALIISKAISIQGHGFSGISAPGGVAITISAGPSDSISLRGLLIDGVGSGTHGITFTAGASLEIQDTLIRNFSSDGMVLSPNATSTFSVVNSVVSHNVRDGIDIIPSGSGSIHGLLDRLVVDNSGGDGVLVLGTSFTGSINVTVRDSSVVSNGLIGIVSTSTATATPTTVTVQNSTIAYNNTGLDASGAAGILRVTKSVITGNNGGVATSVGGTLESFGDNVLRGNTTNGSPTASVALQ